MSLSSVGAFSSNTFCILIYGAPTNLVLKDFCFSASLALLALLYCQGRAVSAGELPAAGEVP
jgi:hypothetical protein